MFDEEYINPESLTSEEVGRLRDDADLREDVQDMLDIRSALTENDVDVEARLEAFHRSHGDETAPVRSFPLRRTITALLAAAAVAGIIFLVGRGYGSSEDTAGRAPIASVSVADGSTSAAGRSLDAQTTVDASSAAVSTDASAAMADEMTADADQPVVVPNITVDEMNEIINNDQDRVESLTQTVPYGKSADITLPDGSVAYMHPGSKIVYPKTFVGNQRLVMLEGEAYFKVAKDPQHPFIVMTDDIITTVLGTEFDINTATGEITLINGSIRVKSVKSSAELTLLPHQHAALGGGAFSVSTVDVTPYELWRDGYLYFDNVSLEEIIRSVAYHFGMDVEFRSAESRNLKMRFITERNNGLMPILDKINGMRKVNASVVGNKIVVD